MAVRRSSHTAGQGVHGEPAYVLHRYEWSESSLILELFTRNLGRVAVAAKGVRKPASAFRSVLLPFQPLLVSLGPQAQIRTLRGAEWAGGYAMPTGEPLLVGYYVNELLMRLLAREDVQPLVFDAYAQTLAFIAKHSGEKVAEPMLRVFELILLRALGVLPALNHEALSMRALQPDGYYMLDPENGLMLQNTSTSPSHSRARALPAQQWEQIQQALDTDEEVLNTLPLAVEAVAVELKPALRVLLNHHAGVASLQTRKLMLSLQKRA